MDELNSLASYLSVSSGKLVLDAKEQIPVLKAGNGLTVRGLVSVAKQLVRQSETPELKGTTAEERAAIDQWLEYRVVQVDRSLQEKDVSSVLRDTNAYLSHHVYFVGYQPTLADIILYLGLYRIFVHLQAHRQTLNISSEIQPNLPPIHCLGPHMDQCLLYVAYLASTKSKFCCL